MALKLDRSHAFAHEEAVARLKALTSYWNTKYGVRIDWDGATAKIDGKVNGISFKGIITVEPSRVIGDIDAGFLAEKLGGRKYVEGKLDEYLNANTSLEALAARLA